MVRWKLRGAALLVGVGVLAAACSSSGGSAGKSSGSSGSTGSSGVAGSSGAGASSGSGGGKLSGAPVKLGVLGDLTAAGADQHPNAWKAAQVAQAAVNDSGGISGRPLQLIVCDTKQDPQTAVLCAQQLLIKDKVVAMVGDFESEEQAALYPVLAQANTINFGSFPSIPDDFSNARSYPLAPNPLPYFGMGRLVPAGSKKVAIVHGNSAPANALATQLAKALPAGTASISIAIPVSGVVDMSPYCLQLQQSHADTALALIADTVVNQLESTCQSHGVSGVQWVLSDLGLDSDSAKLFANVSPAPKVLMTFAGPALAVMKQQVAKYGSKFGNPDTTNALDENSWLAVTVAAQILSKLPTISGPALRAYLDQQTALTTGATPPINFTKPGPAKAFPRIVNTSAAPGIMRNGQVVQTGDFINLAG